MGSTPSLLNFAAIVCSLTISGTAGDTKQAIINTKNGRSLAAESRLLITLHDQDKVPDIFFDAQRGELINELNDVQSDESTPGAVKELVRHVIDSLAAGDSEALVAVTARLLSAEEANE